MFFFFSKVLLIFILPLTWIVACLLIAAFVKKPILKRRFFLSGLVLLLIFSNPFLYNTFTNHWDVQPSALPANKTYSCAIVLGGFSSADPDGHGFFNGAADRFIEGLRLIVTHKISHILISGGNGDLRPGSFRESSWVKMQLLQFGVPDSCIIVERNSRNTLENAAFSKKILESKHLAGPYILVTSCFHMRRSLLIFQNANMNVVPFACNVTSARAQFTLDQFLPDAVVLGGWNTYIKELVGTLTNFIRWHI